MSFTLLRFETPHHGKRAKKPSVSTSKSSVTFSDQTALDRRTQRFQREHQLEKIKKLRPDTPHTAQEGSALALSHGHGQRRESEHELEFVSVLLFPRLDSPKEQC